MMPSSSGPPIRGVEIPLSGGAVAIIGIIFMLFGWGLFLWGCCMYAKGKGYHGAWGLLALLSLPGLLILVLFKDEHK